MQPFRLCLVKTSSSIDDISLWTVESTTPPLDVSKVPFTAIYCVFFFL